MENLYLIVGLGNPGAEYADTRHNAGFQVVRELAERWRVAWKAEERAQSRVARLDRADKRVLLCQPQTFMNRSGEAVGKLRDYFRIPTNRILIVTDDADLPIGEIRMRPHGGTGGHHGLESVEAHLAGRDYPRQRIGIGRRGSVEHGIAGHVLGRFDAGERGVMRMVIGRAADQIEAWLDGGIESAMNQFNGVVSGPKKEEAAE